MARSLIHGHVRVDALTLKVTGLLKELFVVAPDNPDSETSWQQSVYDDLKAIAQGAIAQERPGNSLQATIIANDAYLKLLQQRNLDPSNSSQLRAAGAVIIRRLLVDYARSRKAEKRGGKDGRGIPLHVSVPDSARPIDVLELNEALAVLGQENARAATVVELKFFGGLSAEEIAESLEVSIRTVNNDWRFAKAWLYRELSGQKEGS
ncbi:MAG: transcriptional regulator [Planctomycetaceae bacterium]|nr:transcriptional regulator [Planctomycetaceae bacterium]